MLPQQHCGTLGPGASWACRDVRNVRGGMGRGQLLRDCAHALPHLVPHGQSLSPHIYAYQEPHLNDGRVLLHRSPIQALAGLFFLFQMDYIHIHVCEFLHCARVSSVSDF